MNTAASKWQCPICASGKVQISLPVWFREDTEGNLTQCEVDTEASPRYWYCEDCSESGNGEPDLSSD